MGHPPVGTGSRGGPAPVPRGSGTPRNGPGTTRLTRSGPVRAAGPRSAPGRGSAARPVPRASGDATRQRVPLRLTVALLLTVGTVVLIGFTDDAPARTTTAADCASGAPAGDLSPVQSRNARIITGVAVQRGLDKQAAEIAIATALSETGLLNYANDGTSDLYASEIDRPLSDVERAVARRSLDYPHDEVGSNLDSIGLFQQRPTTGWGPPERLIVPATAAGLFYDRLLKIRDWRSGVPWQMAQKVQGSPSSDGGIYEKSYDRAVAVVDELWAEPACTGT